MTIDAASILLLGSAIKHCLTVVIAGFSIYFGYRLFYVSVEKASEFEATLPWGKIKLANAAPGVFFTLFGCIVLITEAVTANSYKASNDAPAPAISTEGQRTAATSTVDVRAASGGLKTSYDWRLCAQSANYALNDMRSNPNAIHAAGPPNPFRIKAQDGLERTLAYCVDQAVAPGAFGRYQVVERLTAAGGQNDASKADIDLHDRVAVLLAN